MKLFISFILVCSFVSIAQAVCVPPIQSSPASELLQLVNATQDLEFKEAMKAMGVHLKAITDFAIRKDPKEDRPAALNAANLLVEVTNRASQMKPGMSKKNPKLFEDIFKDLVTAVGELQSALASPSTTDDLLKEKFDSVRAFIRRGHDVFREKKLL